MTYYAVKYWRRTMKSSNKISLPLEVISDKEYYQTERIKVWGGLYSDENVCPVYLV